MRLYRCRWDRKIGGVCGGIGKFLKVDATVIRLFTVVLCFLTAFFPIAILYLILWAVMPEGPAAYVQNPAKKLFKSRKNRKIAGVCGGIAEYLRIDATIVRVIFIVLLVFTFFFPVFFLYIIFAFLIPERPFTKV